ncbi:hypothetical protein DP116_19345 [Brasilonema bromeliae SPC951]|uniref:Uncharacterized protein n=1 Tax=Brasilonema bromeliae SPC951 TaxID=385972 RepID=A0ABX1PBY0_9CYAN|nr:hypothetical protein [Brasilonema bromeliae SPC951]
MKEIQQIHSQVVLELPEYWIMVFKNSSLAVLIAPVVTLSTYSALTFSIFDNLWAIDCLNEMSP